MRTRIPILGLIFLIGALLGIANPASAKSTVPNQDQKSTVVVEKSSEVKNVASKASSTATVTVLQWQMSKGLPKSVVNRSKCWTDSNGFWNSGFRNGVQYWFWDTRPSVLCKTSSGKTYRKLCGNEVRASPPPNRIIHGIVVLIKNSGKYSAKVTEKATAKARDWCGEASATASASAKVSGSTKMQARGNAKLVASVKATVKATVSAAAKVICGPKSPPANPGGGCVSGSTNTNSGNQCAQASTETTVKVVPTCTAGDNVTNSCNTYINVTNTTYQFNCSKVTVTNSSTGTVVSETWYAEDGSQTTEQICSSNWQQQQCVNNGDTWNGETNVCTSKQEVCTAKGWFWYNNMCNQYPQCKQDCEPQKPDNAPDIMCVFPAHMYKTPGANVTIWCEAWDSDGDSVSVNIVGDSYGHTSGTVPTDVRWDKTACPQGRSCFKSTYWADRATPSGVNARITATVTAKGKSTSIIGEFPIYEDDFGRSAQRSGTSFWDTHQMVTSEAL